MLAARYLGPDHIEAQTVAVPTPGPDEALIAVEACGFCGSDGTHPRAQAPLTVGHEIAGSIVQLPAGTDSGLRIGDRVTVFPLISCGHCYACTHGLSHVCRQLRLFGFDVDGGMAEYLRVPVEALMRLPADMPPTIGALIEPLAVAVHGTARIALTDVTLAVVLGAGPIGLLTALVLRSRGVQHVLISDVQQQRLDLASSCGLEALHAGEPLRARVMELSQNNGADTVFECAGHPSSATEMTTLVRSRGRIVNLGVFKKPAEVDLQAINFKEIELLGSRVYERRDFQSAIDLAPTLPLDRIVSHTFALTEASDAFRRFQSSDACKVLILPGRKTTAHAPAANAQTAAEASAA